MRLTLTTDEGVLLDSREITREEWEQAQNSHITAWSILTDLQPGDLEERE